MLQNQDIAMIILLPNEDAELQTLEKNFNWETLDKTPRSNDEIELYLPRFKFEITMDLEDILRKVHHLQNTQYTNDKKGNLDNF